MGAALNTLKTVVLKARGKASLNYVDDFVTDEFPEFRDEVKGYDLTPGRPPLFGAGEPPFIEIKITYPLSASELAEKVDRIVAHAQENGSEDIVVEYLDEVEGDD